MYDSEGEFAGYIGSCTDVTERVEAQADLAAAKEAEIKAIRARKARMEQMIEYVVLGVASVILSALIVYGVYIYMMYIKK
jgi:t-SNARE complex subunit (syntaxin)